MCGCVGVWVCGCVGVRVCGCVRVIILAQYSVVFMYVNRSCTMSMGGMWFNSDGHNANTWETFVELY